MQKTEWELITPEKATEYLKRNHPRNRPPTRSTVTKLARDMTDGRFYETHQGIAFDVEGLLVDGQKRLMAILQSGKPQRMLVTRGLPLQALEVIDGGDSRTQAQQLTISGRPITDKQVALVRAIVGGMAGRAKLRNFEVWDYFEQLRPAIEFADQHASHRKVNRCIRAVICRAWHKPAENDEERRIVHERIVEFCKVLTSSEVSSSGDGAAVSLIKCMARYEFAGESGQRDLYRITERALLHFLDFQSPGQLKPVASEAFPLPWEADDAKEEG